MAIPPIRPGVAGTAAAARVPGGRSDRIPGTRPDRDRRRLDRPGHRGSQRRLRCDGRKSRRRESADVAPAGPAASAPAASGAGAGSGAAAAPARGRAAAALGCGRGGSAAATAYHGLRSRQQARVGPTARRARTVARAGRVRAAAASRLRRPAATRWAAQWRGRARLVQAQARSGQAARDCRGRHPTRRPSRPALRAAACVERFCPAGPLRPGRATPSARRPRRAGRPRQGPPRSAGRTGARAARNRRRTDRRATR